MAEAVATLGLGTILDQLEAATQTAGKELIATAQTVKERYERLLQVEGMLGCAPEPVKLAAMPVHARLLLTLLGHGGATALGAALLGSVVVLLCFFLGVL
jgi:hypothetical protein